MTDYFSEAVKKTIAEVAGEWFFVKGKGCRPVFAAHEGLTDSQIDELGMIIF